MLANLGHGRAGLRVGFILKDEGHLNVALFGRVRRRRRFRRGGVDLHLLRLRCVADRQKLGLLWRRVDFVGGMFVEKVKFLTLVAKLKSEGIG